MRERLRRLLKLDDSPHRIALSFAVGIFITVSPFYGLHTLLGVLAFTLFRLNKMAVLLGAAVNLPWFSPGVYFPCYFLGATIWQIFPAHESFRLFSWDDFTFFFSSWEAFKLLFQPSNFLKVFLPTLVGTTIVGSFSSIGSYYLVREWVRRRREIRQSLEELKEVELNAEGF